MAATRWHSLSVGTWGIPPNSQVKYRKFDISDEQTWYGIISDKPKWLLSPSHIFGEGSQTVNKIMFWSFFIYVPQHTFRLSRTALIPAFSSFRETVAAKKRQFFRGYLLLRHFQILHQLEYAFNKARTPQALLLRHLRLKSGPTYIGSPLMGCHFQKHLHIARPANVRRSFSACPSTHTLDPARVQDAEQQMEVKTIMPLLVYPKKRAQQILACVYLQNVSQYVK